MLASTKKKTIEKRAIASGVKSFNSRVVTILTFLGPRNLFELSKIQNHPVIYQDTHAVNAGRKLKTIDSKLTSSWFQCQNIGWRFDPVS